MTVKSNNIKAISHRLSNEDRWRRQDHRGGVLWLTGLPGSGKSTLAFDLERRLFDSGQQVYAMDGDNLRYGLNSDLGFSPSDRSENIRRVGEVAALYADAGLIAITAFISPYRADRQAARRAAGERFHEVFLSASLDVCEGRDPKGHYEKARAGKIPDFTGVSAPYEVPENAELVIDTGVMGVADCLDILVDYVDTAFRLDGG
ncbi:MAG: adenylyl-sulfate kinase [Alphaproteobacteria bacterium]|jgi:bifunctional enzyme CysN/CysC|nr:adenylyl-sulfate kinase [Alphaproteobacteria bacterium]MBT7942667.1 adenylyl-sulfate kinase [Alphaproteobacteria bacterium]